MALTARRALLPHERMQGGRVAAEASSSAVAMLGNPRGGGGAQDGEHCTAALHGNAAPSSACGPSCRGIRCECHYRDVLLRDPLQETSCYVFNALLEQYSVSVAQLTALQGRLRGRVVLPNQVLPYNTLREQFNKRFSIYPAAIVEADSEDDVVCAIQFARAHRLLIGPRGGNHAYEVRRPTCPEWGIFLPAFRAFFPRLRDVLIAREPPSDAPIRAAQPYTVPSFGIVIDQRRRSTARVSSKRHRAVLGPGLLLGPTTLALCRKDQYIPFGTSLAEAHARSRIVWPRVCLFCRVLVVVGTTCEVVV
jgi:hypothetical protein